MCCVLCLVAQSCPTLCNPMACSPPDSSVHGNSPSKNTEVGCHALLQGIFLTQGSNPGLPHCLAHSKCYIRILLFTQSCLTLFNPMDCSTPGFPVLHQLLEFAQLNSIESVVLSTQLILCLVQLVQLLPPAFSLSQHQGLFR